MNSGQDSADKDDPPSAPGLESALARSQRIANMGSWTLNLATGELAWSEQMYTVYGADPRGPAMTPAECLASVHADDVAMTQAAFKRAVDERLALDLVHRVCAPDGTIRHVHVRGETAYAEDGTPLSCSGTAQDVTLEVLREQTLGNRERSLQAIFSAMAEGLVIHGPNGQVIEANPAAEAILGLSRQALLGKTSADPRWHAVTEAGEPYPAGQHPAMRTFRSGLPLRDQVMGIMDPHRGLRWISINTSPLWGEGEGEGTGQGAGAGKPVPDAVVATFVDITERRQHEERLRALSAEFQDLYDNAPCGYHSVDDQGRYLRVNATELTWLGCRAEDLIGRASPADFLTPEGRERFRLVFAQLLAGGRVEGLPFEMVGANGVVRKVSLSASAVTDERGRYLRSRGILYDVTELERSREQLRVAMSEQHAMLDNDLVGMVKLRRRQVVWKNRAMLRIFGYEHGELQGQSMRILYPSDTSFDQVGKAGYAELAAGRSFRSQVEMVRKGGERIWIDASGVLLSPEDDESIWFLADITELKRYQERFERMAHIDTLTGLPNRVLLADRMEQALALAQRHQYETAVVYIDLDEFRAVNDGNGHAAGDQVLRETARRLHSAIRKNDTAARLGGDEFVILLTHVDGAAKVELFLQRIRALLAGPVSLADGSQVVLSASVGVAMAPDSGWDAEELLRRADAAMYAAKKLGKNCVHFYRAAVAGGSPSVH